MKTRTIQITAGNGPIECAWVVAKVLKIVLREASASKLNYTIVNQEKGEENGIVRSANIQLSGDANSLADFMRSWIGTIQWIGQSNYRKNHKRKNWFIGVTEIEDAYKLELKDSEIKYQAIRSSGPGGQHVNKVSSAIRAIHIPTGIQVVAMDRRSQHQNKKLAKQRLQERVTHQNKENYKTSIKNQWENHQKLERGNPIKTITGSNFKYKKVRKNNASQRQQLKNELRREL